MMAAVLRLLLLTVVMLCPSASAVSAAALTFTVATSEPVTVTGMPRISIDVGGIARYATYAAGSGTAALTFSYAVQAGDFDANGIALASPLELNGGTIADLAGNPAAALTFTLPNTSSLKVQTYTAAFTTSPITEANANAVGFAIAKAPAGASFTYSITSSGGAGSVTGSGTIGSSTHTVSGVDVSGLPLGTLTLSVTVSTAAGGAGEARTATASPSFTGILDSLSPAAAFSIRRLRSAYAGSLIRVRRSSDNTAQDIDATLGGNLNTAALASFCGASSCFVTTWYDQSGNGRDAAQSITANQPRVVNAGVIDTVGGRPGLVWPSVANSAALQTAASFTVASVSVVSQYGDGARTGWLVDSQALFATNGTVILAGTAAGQATFWTSSAFQQWGRNGAALAAVANATAFPWPLQTVYATASPALTGPWYIGRDRGIPLRGWSGPIPEFVMFPATLSAGARLSLERSQGAYFGISVP